jgi:hypothetical protein
MVPKEEVSEEERDTVGHWYFVSCPYEIYGSEIIV